MQTYTMFYDDERCYAKIKGLMWKLEVLCRGPTF